MNRKLITSLFLMVLMAGVLLSAPAARADVTLVLDNPNQGGSLGQTFSFTGTITNNTASTVFLNSDSYTFGLPLDDSPFFSFPLSLAAGASASGLLFTVTLAPSTPYGVYTGFFDILGGANGGSSDLLASAAFSVAVPEPASMLLLGTGLSGLAGIIRRKRQK